jgi:diguanylate cyclase (GGDEF)-like protein/PAS domain S-box-containing protein
MTSGGVAAGGPGDHEDLATQVADLLAERDELAIGLPVGFYTGWFDSGTAEFHFDYISGRAAELLGVEPQDLMRDWRTMLANVDPEHIEALEYEATAVTEPGDEVDWTGRVVHGGQELWLHVSARESTQRPGRWLGVVEDVTERTYLQIGLTRLAMTDPLTDLGNRRLFEERGTLLMDGWRRAGGWIALAVIDIDHVKTVNDRLGHAAGDRALSDIGGILRRWGRRSDVLARMGGDEFAVLMPGTDAAEATAALSRIQATLQDRREHAEHLEPLSLSVGIAAVDADEEPSDIMLDDLMRRADVALQQAKAAGRAHIVVFAH